MTLVQKVILSGLIATATGMLWRGSRGTPTEKVPISIVTERGYTTGWFERSLQEDKEIVDYDIQMNRTDGTVIRARAMNDFCYSWNRGTGIKCVGKVEVICREDVGYTRWQYDADLSIKKTESEGNCSVNQKAAVVSVIEDTILSVQ